MRGRADAFRKAVEVARQVVIGMAAAHEKEIVHRDLKPDNIFLTRDDRAKNSGFWAGEACAGRRRCVRRNADGIDDDRADDRQAGVDGAGIGDGHGWVHVAGEVRGQTVDYRSDIFSFGTILYEMVTGKRAFAGDSAIETMNAILKSDVEEIDPSKFAVSPGIAPIVRHCMRKIRRTGSSGEGFGICAWGVVGNGNTAGDDREWRDCGDRYEECGQMALGVESGGGSAGGSVPCDGVVGVSQARERRATGVCDCDAGRSITWRFRRMGSGWRIRRRMKSRGKACW